MNDKQGKLLSLADIEGKISPHQGQVKGGLRVRAVALEYVKNVQSLADYIGGSVQNLGIKEDWAVGKELYPGVIINFAFFKADSEFPARFQALYSGERVEMVHGDELANITISLANQVVRYVRESNPDLKLPEVCYKV
jgi:hypothetical protein